jgi:hypothetical protein
VTRARGWALQNALAAYLRTWFPHAESAGAGRPGSDILGTPGIDWECKTAVAFKEQFRPLAWVRQSEARAGADGEIPVVVYFPAGIGALNAGNALAIMPVHVLMQLLVDAGWADRPAPVPAGEAGAAL